MKKINAITSHESILQLHSRKKIYEMIKKYAGTHFRELERKTGLPTGTLQYHLHYLSKHGIIKEEKKGNTIQYFTKEIPQLKRALLGSLRQKTMRHILLCILNNKECSQKEIVRFLRLSPSTTSWHLQKLIKEGTIKTIKKGKESYYVLNGEEEKILHLLITYRESFLDRVVDQTIEMWSFQ